MLENAIVWDTESFPNFWSMNVQALNSDAEATFVISPWRDDRQQLLQYLQYLQQNQIPMIGFNSVGYDYPMLHWFIKNPNETAEGMNYQNDLIINGTDRFKQTIWADQRFIPQIDLYKLHHLDNKNKRTSLKALQFVMRARSVLESKVEFGRIITHDEAFGDVIPYNSHDTFETKRLAQYSMDAMNFRVGLIPQFGVDVLNWNDTKIGEEMLIQRMGEDVCYVRTPIIGRDGQPWVDRDTGLPKTRRTKRQTIRSSIPLAEIIFPYIQFQHPEFRRVLDYMRQQVLRPDEFADDNKIKTKGVFTNLCANIDGFEFHYGLGGIHGSVSAQKIVAGNGWRIRDIDVASLYPSIAIVNNLAPEHLGSAFTSAYARLPAERKEWQKKKGKKCAEANSMKLAGNGAYGKSNDQYSVLFDPKYTMTVTVNGQLLLSMLSEWLLTVPTLKLIQVNTDGITYLIHDDHEPQAAAICRQWEQFTCLVLEDVEYSRMWIRDVGSYVAEAADGTLKQKGAYWHPDPARFVESIAEQQPPAWHKDHSCPIVQRAAVVAMTQGVDPAHYILGHTDPFDFMLRAKVSRADKLMLGDVEQQKLTRYYIARNGSPLVKIMPPKGIEGEYKRKNGLDETFYRAVAATLQPGQWDERIHTANKSRHEMRATAFEAGYLVAECNNVESFRFDNLNYQYYIDQARKLIIE